MIRLGLLGHPAAHSLSPAIHRAALAALGLQDSFRYDALDVPPAQLGAQLDLLRRGGWRGVNVTHPHKVTALGLLDDAGPAGRLGAVNTVVVEEGGRLVGHNTDGPGFLRALAAFEGRAAGGSALQASAPLAEAVLLGAGGAARGIAVALAGQGCRVHLVSRRPDPAEELLARLPAAQQGSWAPWSQSPETARLLACAGLVVGCTSLAAGVRPGGAAWRQAEQAWDLLPLGALDPCTRVVDIVYRPATTPLLQRAAARGCPVLGGLGMLVEQAALSFSLWTGRPAPLAVMERAARTAGAGGSMTVE